MFFPFQSGTGLACKSALYALIVVLIKCGVCFVVKHYEGSLRCCCFFPVSNRARF